MDGPANRSRGVYIDQGEEESVSKGDSTLGTDVEFEVTGGPAGEVIGGMGVETPVDCPGKIRLILRIPCVRGPESCCTNGLGLVVNGYADGDPISDHNGGGNPDIQVMSEESYAGRTRTRHSTVGL